MTNESPVRVVPAPHFRRAFKKLRKKYPHIGDDIQPLLEQLEQSETPGDRIQGLNAVIYKVRVPNRDAQRGKSGGYRVIYYLHTETFIFLVEIYSKSEREDISIEELSEIVEALEIEDNDETS